MSDVMEMDYDDDDFDYGDDDYSYDYDFDVMHCGAVDDKRLCVDIGTEWCSFHCRLHKIYVTDRQNSPEYDLLPDPPDDIYAGFYGDDTPNTDTPSADIDDIPF